MGELIERYRQMAANGGNFYGLAILQHAGEIGLLLQRHDARTVLDYGSGRGDAYAEPYSLHERAWHIPKPTLYDPAFPDIDEMPERRFDAVICSDVLEHVPEDEVDGVICDLLNHARKMVWASVCCRLAKKTFPDGGGNMHVTVKPMAWWRSRFAELSDGAVPYYLRESP